MLSDETIQTQYWL